MKKKGFTLIELLAVIVILAVIALIATPIVLNLIEQARKGSAKDSAYGVRKAGQLYYQQILLNNELGISDDITIEFNNGQITSSSSNSDAEYKLDGTVPESGSITITNEGQISGNVVINGYACIIPENGKISCEKSNKYINYEIQNSGKWTQSKTLSITFDNSCTDKTYSLDNGATWNNYTESITLTENKTVKAKCNNEQIRDITVDKIDNTQVELNAIPFSTRATPSTITITVNDPVVGASGVKEYGISIDNGATWVKQNSKVYIANVESGTYPVKVKVYNNTYDENMSAEEKAKASAESEVQNVTTATLTAPEVTYSPAYGTWAQTRVITIDYHGLEYAKYSYDGTTYIDYTAPIVVNSNGNIYVKYGFSENESNTETIVEDNIYNETPTFTVTASSNAANEVTISANVSGIPGGVYKYQYSLDNGSSWSEETDDNPYTVSASGTVNPKVRIITNAYHNTVENADSNKGIVEEAGNSVAVITPSPIPTPVATASTLQVGNLVKMVPTETSVQLDGTKSGYTDYNTTATYINPSELQYWRVIRKNDDDTIDVVSEYVSSVDVYFNGVKGYKNFIAYLNELASHYENSNFTVGSRHMGYDSTKATETLTSTTAYSSSSTSPWSTTSSGTTRANEAKGAGDMGYTTDGNLVRVAYTGTTIYGTNASGTAKAYKVGNTTAVTYWLASRYYYEHSSSYYHFGGRYIDKSGAAESGQSLRLYDDGWQNTIRHLPIRPILTLKSTVKAYSVESSTGAYVLG